ncbi:MAG: sensor histidine kinase [Sphingobacteriia bacterium]|nr:sensor histidine kinase [Sphingobacteriia bacterium]
MKVSVFDKLSRFCYERTDEIYHQYQSFAIYFLASFILICLHPTLNFAQNPFQLVGVTLSIILMFYEMLPENLLKYLRFYWLIVLFYCLPFLSTLIVFNNSYKIEALIGNALSLFMLATLTDWLTFIAFFSIGFGFATLVYIKTNCLMIIPYLIIQHENFFVFLYTYIISFIIVIVFSRKKNLIEQETINNYKFINGILAHELNTPFAALNLHSSSLESNLPYFYSVYEKAVKAGILKEKLGEAKYEIIKNTHNDIKEIIKKIYNINDMFSYKLNENIEEKKLRRCNIRTCIQQALDEYPFTSSSLKKVVWHEKETNFNFLGEETLIKHVLFNLIKNALFHAKKESIIEIWGKRDERANYLFFRDTGKGISSENLPYIFERFYSKNAFSTGLGLYFCKVVMHSFKGDISCNSLEGHFTEFKLTFPYIK